MATDFDRTVHGYTASGAEIARYDRAGKWYVEPAEGKRRHVTLAEAAELALSGRVLPNRYCGTRFDAKVRALRSA